MFMDATAAIYILVPILLPTVIAVHIEPVFFIVFLVITLALGLVTPPVGVCLYAVTSVTGIRLETLITHTVPWLIITAITLLLFIIFPWIITGPIAWFF